MPRNIRQTFPFSTVVSEMDAELLKWNQGRARPSGGQESKSDSILALS